jgi:hypothetical protein
VVSLGVPPTLSAAFRWYDTRSLRALIEILCGSPGCTNQYTNPPEMTVNNEQSYTAEFGLNKWVLAQATTTAKVLRLTLNL